MPTTADEAYHKIQHVLLSGELRPGQKVSQLKLAERLGCSTVPVVEAMRRLESEGLLVKEPRRMARVRELSADDLEGLYLVREGLEAVAARRCAARITDEQIEQLCELNKRFEAALAAADDEQIKRLDVKIHKVIAEAAGCKLLEHELNRMLLIEKTAGRDRLNRTREPSTHSHHHALIQAMADHDVEAAEYLMKKHIQLGFLEMQSAGEDA